MGKRRYSAKQHILNNKNSPSIKTRSYTKSKNKNQIEKITENLEKKKQQIEENRKNLGNTMAEPQQKLGNLIQHLPLFDGKKENNIIFYLRQFDELADITQLTDEIKVIILKAKFTGQARDTLINTPDINEENDYHELKNKLILEFQSKITLEEAQEDFANVKQQPAQTIDEFAKIFNLKALKYMKKSGHATKQGAVDFFETIKLSKFLDAIRADISLEVRKIAPGSFDEAVKIAKQIENAFKTINKEEVNQIQSHNSGNVNETILNLTTSHMNEIQKLKRDLENLKLTNSQAQEENQNFCHICKIKSHTTEACFYNSKNKRRSQNRGNNNFQDKNMQQAQTYSQYPIPYMYMNPAANWNAYASGFSPMAHTNYAGGHNDKQNFYENYNDKGNFSGNHNNRGDYSGNYNNRENYSENYNDRRNYSKEYNDRENYSGNYNDRKNYSREYDRGNRSEYQNKSSEHNRDHHKKDNCNYKNNTYKNKAKNSGN